MKYIITTLGLAMTVLTASANEKDSALTNYDRTIQLGIVNNQHNSIGSSIAYTHKVKPNKIHRYSFNIHQYNDNRHYIDIAENNIIETTKSIEETTYTASFGQQFYKNVFRNLDINCGYDVGVGYSKLNENRRTKLTQLPSNTSIRHYAQTTANGLVVRIVPYVGTVIHLSNRWFLSGEFSMQSPRFSVHFGDRTAADFNLYFLNSSFRVGFKF